MVCENATGLIIGPFQTPLSAAKTIPGKWGQFSCLSSGKKTLIIDGENLVDISVRRNLDTLCSLSRTNNMRCLQMKKPRTFSDNLVGFPEEMIEGISAPEFDFSTIRNFNDDVVAFDYRPPPEYRGKSGKDKLEAISREQSSFLDKEKSPSIRDIQKISSKYPGAFLPSLDLVITVGDLRNMTKSHLTNPEYINLIRKYEKYYPIYIDIVHTDNNTELSEKFEEVSSRIKDTVSHNFDFIQDLQGKNLVYSAECTIIHFSIFLLGEKT